MCFYANVKAPDEEAAVTGNSHQVPPPISVDKHAPQENHKPAVEHAAESHKKEKSVLQAKLTKLAIQIGYAGTWSSVSLFADVRERLVICIFFYRFDYRHTYSFNSSSTVLRKNVCNR